MMNLYPNIEELHNQCNSKNINFKQLIKEAFDVVEVEIQDCNNIRISNPCKSHWLNNEEMELLLSYSKENYFDTLNASIGL